MRPRHPGQPHPGQPCPHPPGRPRPPAQPHPPARPCPPARLRPGRSHLQRSPARELPAAPAPHPRRLRRWPARCPGRTRRPRCHPSRGTPYGPCCRIRLPRPVRCPPGQWPGRRRIRDRAGHACRAPASDSAPGGSTARFGSTKVTGASARDRDTSPIRPAREPAELTPDGRWRWAASALRSLQRLPRRSPLPSLAGSPPSREQRADCPAWQAAPTPSCVRERAMDPTACTPMPGPSRQCLARQPRATGCRA